MSSETPHSIKQFPNDYATTLQTMRAIFYLYRKINDLEREAAKDLLKELNASLHSLRELERDISSIQKRFTLD